MKKNYLVFVTLLSFCALGLACKKSSGSGKSRTELITQSAWKFEYFGTDANKDGQVEISQLDDCNDDDTITFSTNGTGVTNQGSDVCSGSNQTDNWNWSFTNNESVVHIDIDELGDINITTLSDTQLRGYKDVDMGGGAMLRIIVGMKH